MSHSPWLATPSSSYSNSAQELDPWADDGASTQHIPSTSQQQLRSRKSSPAFLNTSAGSSSLASTSQVVDRHPLRSPSPHQRPQTVRSSSKSGPTDYNRRPSTIASEWKGISAGLAGLFNGSSASESAAYKWPADPVTSSSEPRQRRNRSKATSEDHTSSTPLDQDDERQKGHSAQRLESTLDRLEDWFGLRDSKPPSSSNLSSDATHASASGPLKQPPPTAQTAEQVRVLIHPVGPTDTLPSLALHYGADIQVLRKSNKLWPGDPVQIRKAIYIPVDSCKHRPPNAEIKVLPSQGGAITPSAATLAFVPKEEEEDTATFGEPTSSQSQTVTSTIAPLHDPASDFMPDTNKSYADQTLESSAALARSSSINGTRSAYPPSLAPSLRNISARPSSSQAHSRAPSSIGGASNPASASAASSSFVPPRGPIPVTKVPADKLRFFAKEIKDVNTSSGTSKTGPGDPGYNPGETGIDDLLATKSISREPSSSASPLTEVMRPTISRQVSTSNLSDAEDEDWKPNTWHFGTTGKGKAKASAPGEHKTSPSSSGSILPTADDAAFETTRGEYVGWNDAPAADAIVAKAYDGGRAYQKRQAQKSHRLLYDLAAGLPPNPGAASKWARPIQFGDSLPVAPSTSVSSIGRSKTKGGTGFGKLLDDTIRGRISVEKAFEGALEGVRVKAVGEGPPQTSARRTLVPPPRKDSGRLVADSGHTPDSLDRMPRDQILATPHRAEGARGPHAIQTQRGEIQAADAGDPLTAPTMGPVRASGGGFGSAVGLNRRKVEWSRAKGE